MNKKIEYTYKIIREFKTFLLPVLINNCEILAIKESININNTVTIYEYLALKKDYDNVKENINIPILDYDLYFTEIEQYINKTNYNNVDIEKINEFKIKDVYTFLKANKYGNTNKLYKYDYNHHLYNLEGKEYPHAIYFDYMSSNGELTDEYFNLEDCVKILEKNKRIIFIEDKGKIKIIPYYNRIENNYFYISFYWFPTQEEFDILSNNKNGYIKHKYIIDNFLKLKRI